MVADAVTGTRFTSQLQHTFWLLDAQHFVQAFPPQTVAALAKLGGPSEQHRGELLQALQGMPFLQSANAWHAQNATAAATTTMPMPLHRLCVHVSNNPKPSQGGGVPAELGL